MQKKVYCHISFELNGCRLNIHPTQKGTLLLENVYILKNIQIVHKFTFFKVSLKLTNVHLLDSFCCQRWIRQC